MNIKVSLMLALIAMISTGYDTRKSCSAEIITKEKCESGLCIEISASQKEFNFTSDHIIIDVIIRNAGDKQVTIDPYRRIILTVDGEGASRYSLSNTPRPQEMIDPLVLDPGERYTERFENLETVGVGWNLNPGKYLVKANYVLRNPSNVDRWPADYKGPKDNVWMGVLSTGELEIEYKE